MDFIFLLYTLHAVVQLVEALRYETEGRGFDSGLCHWKFFIDIILLAALWPGVESEMSTRYISWRINGAGA